MNHANRQLVELMGLVLTLKARADAAEARADAATQTERLRCAAIPNAIARAALACASIDGVDKARVADMAALFDSITTAIMDGGEK